MTISGLRSNTISPGAKAPVEPSTKDSRLQKACQDFEAVFLTMIWREMLKSTKTDLGGYDTLAEQAIGSHWARSGGIGLAKVMYSNMAKHLPS